MENININLFSIDDSFGNTYKWIKNINILDFLSK